jgi:hypothetical protein
MRKRRETETGPRKLNKSRKKVDRKRTSTRLDGGAPLRQMLISCCVTSSNRNEEEGRFSVVATRHDVLVGRRHRHAQAWTRNVVDGNSTVGHGKVIVTGFGRVLFERVELILLAFVLVFLVIAEWLAVCTRLMGATVSIHIVSSLILVGGQ